MNSKHYACIFSALYVGLLVAAFMLVSIAPRQLAMEQHDVMYVEFIEPETPPEPKPKEVKRDRKVTTPVPNRTPKVSENPPHKQPAEEETTKQSEGPAEETRTVNQRALFQASKEGVDKPADVGNAMAKKDTVTSSAGKGKGLNQFGDVNALLDAGLAGRGSEVLPRPVYPPGNKYGTVVVKVTVSAEGKVTSANVHPVGTNTSDSELKNAALKAARKARFKKIEGLGETSGTITYRFKLN